MKIIIITSLLGTLLLADFVRTGEVVADKDTGLLWQDDHAVKTNMFTFAAAQKYCQTLHLDGYKTWRLPTIEELTTISNKKKYDPAIDDVFKNTASDLYWSSSEVSSKYTWNIDFEGAGTVNRKKTSKDYVRCVIKK